MASGSRALGVFVVAAVAFAVFVSSPADVSAFDSLRDYKCMTRADRYANDPHPNVPAQELADRIEWLYSQCQQNRDAEALAEEQGSKAEKLFPNTSNDRHGHPLHCMSFTDNRFGMHTEHDSANPPPDPTAPGGSATVNIPGEFMYAWIDGKARFMVRYVVWTIDDRDGNVLTPVKINQHPTYMGTPQTTVAVLNFGQAFKPVSIWVEMPDTMAVANNESSGVLPGRRLTVRSWMETHCHDKRDPTVIPQMLIDRMEDLGWQRPEATPREPRVVRFKADGNPNLPSSWSLKEVPVALAPNIFNKGPYRWFYDAGVVYNDPDEEAPTKPKNLVATPTGARRVKLDWSASSDNTAVAGYIVYRNGKRIGFTENTSFVAKGLWPETKYKFKVKAIDEAGNRSVRSRIVSPRTPADTAKPSKPKNVSVAKARKSLTVRWDRASDNVGVSHYVIKVDGSVVGTTDSTSYKITGLKPETKYHVAVRAVDLFDNQGKLVHKHPKTKP